MSAPGQLADLGRYRLGRLLGRGGMGEVYLADDLVLGRQVAIKFLSGERTSEPEARRRLLREAQAAAALDHPGICTIHETGETADGRAFIVMQVAQGETLAAVLARGPLPVRDALLICARIAEALAAAHRHRLVHRDLKPGNVIVNGELRPKLLDFGIAKLVSVPASVTDGSTASGGTGSGTIVGTPAYMSPEQVQQRPLDGRSDLFSLGVVLYECLTGRRAFEGPTSLETVANVLHRHPPAPSSLRPELSIEHDELCARLLAKDPNARFQSAEEVVGAVRVLQPETSSTAFDTGALRAPPWWRRGTSLAAMAAVVALAAVLWQGFRPAPLPAVPAEADRWFRRGTEAVREGAYVTGRKALEEATRLFPQHVLAYGRLAEADAELDDEGSARVRLLRVQSLVPNEARLPEDERRRLRAVRALVLRDVDGAIAEYLGLVNRHPEDAGAWLDLGRAQEAAGLRTAAAESYRTAAARDPQYAAAHLRLGTVAGLASRRDVALPAFAEAERLYRAASNVEGEVEVLLRRGVAADAEGSLQEARADLERALALASNARLRPQMVRARLALSSVTASEGRIEEAERLAAAALRDAAAAGLDTVAADGLVDLAATLRYAGRSEEAEAQALRAVALAEERGARRTAARARIQLAEIREGLFRPKEALAAIESVLPFLRDNRYRRFELFALQVAARAQLQLRQLEAARALSSEVLGAAERLGDDSQVAIAASNLASVLTDLGRYPEALRLRERAEAIRRRQGDAAALPYDLTNRADLLIRLGRLDHAEPVLREVEAGIADGQAAYVGRKRRLTYLKAFAAATQLRCTEAAALARAVASPGTSQDSAWLLGSGVLAFCEARLPGRPASLHADADAPAGDTSEGLYWRAATALARNDPAAALAAAERGAERLADTPNDDLRFRLAAVAAAASRNTGSAADHARAASEALARLRTNWGPDAATFERRPDIVDLKRRAGLA